MSTVTLTLKKPQDSARVNQRVSEAFAGQDEVPLHFTTEADNQEWLDDINNNPDSTDRHLRPDDRDLTMAELKRVFGTFMVVGQCQVDVSFGRTEVEDMQGILAFISAHRQAFVEVRNIGDLVERSETGDTYQHLLGLDLYLGEYSSKLPKKHPKRDGKFTGPGVALVNTTHNRRAWVVYGSVDSPRFKKQREYINPIDDDLMCDKDGHGVIEVPLLISGDDLLTQQQRIYEQAKELGVTEPFEKFIGKVYPATVLKPLESNRSGHALMMSRFV